MYFDAVKLLSLASLVFTGDGGSGTSDIGKIMLPPFLVDTSSVGGSVSNGQFRNDVSDTGEPGSVGG